MKKQTISKLICLQDKTVRRKDGLAPLAYWSKAVCFYNCSMIGAESTPSGRKR